MKKSYKFNSAASIASQKRVKMKECEYVSTVYLFNKNLGMQSNLTSHQHGVLLSTFSMNTALLASLQGEDKVHGITDMPEPQYDSEFTTEFCMM